VAQANAIAVEMGSPCRFEASVALVGRHLLTDPDASLDDFVDANEPRVSRLGTAKAQQGHRLSTTRAENTVAQPRLKHNPSTLLSLFSPLSAPHVTFCPSIPCRPCVRMQVLVSCLVDPRAGRITDAATMARAAADFHHQEARSACFRRFVSLRKKKAKENGKL